MKTCKKCGVAKPLTEFYAHPKARDGHSGTCKACRIAYVQGKYERKRPVCPPGHRYCPHCRLVKPVEEFGENAARTPKRSGEPGRQGYCKECWPKYQKGWRQEPTARFIASARQKRWQKTPTGKLKQRARLFTGLAIKFGYLVPQPCEVTGCEAPTQPHHTQYDKPLDGIRWLCARHHLAAHGGRWNGPSSGA